MRLMEHKGGLMTSYEDFFKGLLFGLVVGAAITYLILQNIIPVPFL